MLKEKLMDDLKNSMKEKNEIRKNTIQMVRAAILQIEKDKGITLIECLYDLNTVGLFKFNILFT